MSPAVTAWLARAVADARQRNLPQLEPLLESLAKSLQALRDADAEFGHPVVAASGYQPPASSSPRAADDE